MLGTSHSTHTVLSVQLLCARSHGRNQANSSPCLLGEWVNKHMVYVTEEDMVHVTEGDMVHVTQRNTRFMSYRGTHGSCHTEEHMVHVTEEHMVHVTQRKAMVNNSTGGCSTERFGMGSLGRGLPRPVGRL